MKRRTKETNINRVTRRLSYETLEERKVLSAASFADFNGDRVDDAVILGGTDAGGMLSVKYGMWGAGADPGRVDLLSAGQFFIPGDTSPLDNQFGSALAAGDFNGDGFDDLAIGSRGASPFNFVNAGVVHVLYGSSQGLGNPSDALVLYQGSGLVADTPEAGDQFGNSLAAGNFNGDRNPATGLPVDDLAIGAWVEDVDDAPDAGMAHVVYGSYWAGLTSTAINLTVTSDAARQTPGRSDHFGEALAAGDMTGDGFDDLAIGIPFRTVSQQPLAGAVFVMAGGEEGVNALTSRWIDQGSSQVEDEAEAADRFGQVMAIGDFNQDGRGDLAVGIPHEDVGARVDAGAVAVFYFRDDRFSFMDWLITQNTRNMPDEAEDHDNFGFSLAVGNFDAREGKDLAIGVPLEDLGSAQDAGLVHLLYGLKDKTLMPEGSQVYRQGANGISDISEDGDNFGWALSAGDYDGDGYDDLLIAVPGEDFKLDDAPPVEDAGALHALRGDLKKAVESIFLHLGTLNDDPADDNLWLAGAENWRLGTRL